MAIVNEIKCARCDRKYSGVRSRCPYCGARRIGRGKYSEDSDNARGKMLISVLILAVFTVAAGVLLFTTPVDADAQIPDDDPSLSIDDPEGDTTSLPGLLPPPPPTAEPTTEPDPVVRLEISSIAVTHGTSPIGDSFTLTARESGIELRLTIMPDFFDKGDDFSVSWESSNTDVIEVVEVPMGRDDMYGGKITKIGAGQATLTVTVKNFGTEHVWSCLVYSRV